MKCENYFVLAARCPCQISQIDENAIVFGVHANVSKNVSEAAYTVPHAWQTDFNGMLLCAFKVT